MSSTETDSYTRYTSDEYYDEDGGGDFTVTDSGEYSEDPFDVLDFDDVFQEIEDMKNDIYSLTGLPSGLCSIVLAQHQWDKEKLLEELEFYDYDWESLVDDSKVLQPDSRFHKYGTCGICFDENISVISFSCDHWFCSNCWKGYLNSKIEEKEYLIKCPGDKCKSILSQKIVRSLVKDNQMFKKYRIVMAEDFIRVNEFYKFCHGKNCGKIIKGNFSDTYGVECICGESFCLKCDNHGNHDPLTCDLLEQWIKMTGKENETSNWLRQNSKPCPRCKKPIEKNDGCKYITCRNGCNFEFCWECLGKRTKRHRCNQVDDVDEITEQFAGIALGNSKDLMHYYTKFIFHEEKLKFESNSKKLLDQQIQKLRQNNGYEFLQDALTILVKCRRVVMFSYPFALFFRYSKKNAIFKQKQSNLEVQVEHLRGLLEQKFALGNEKLKQQIIKVSEYLNVERETLLKYAYEIDC